MNLNVFIEKGKEDSNLFWRLSSGEHQNLLDEAIEKLEIAEANSQSGEAGVSKWRDVKEELPKNMTECLTIDNYRVKIVCEFIKNTWYETYGHWRVVGGITHWMPLPESPRRTSDGVIIPKQE